MNWIKITKNTESPDEEVLCYGNQGEKLFGFLANDEESGEWFVESEGVLLESVTHYMIIEDPKK